MFPVVISQNLAAQLFGNAQPIGRSITLPRVCSSPARDVSVIGVANDVHWNNLTGDRPRRSFSLPACRQRARRPGFSRWKR